MIALNFVYLIKKSILIVDSWKYSLFIILYAAEIKFIHA